MSRALIDNYIRAQSPYDPGVLGEVRHPEWSTEYPQSGELIASHDADVQINSAYPGYPQHQLNRIAGSSEAWIASLLPFAIMPIRISGAGDLWIAELKLDYPDAGAWHSIAILELRNGRVWRDTVYFCEPFAPAAWRSDWVDPMPERLRPIMASMSPNRDAEDRHRRAFVQYIETSRVDLPSAVRGLFGDDAVEQLPQSGERIAGADQILRVSQAHPDAPTARIRRLRASGDVLVAELALDYAGDPWFAVEILEFEANKVATSTGYFAPPFEAPAWREAWVSRLES